MKVIINNKSGATKRKQLRNNSTPAEIILWTLIKNKQLEGRKFRRQFGFGGYILDFYCHSERLAIELDGNDHFTEKGLKRDKIRDAYLTKVGITVLRIENEVLLKHTSEALQLISSHFKK